MGRPRKELVERYAPLNQTQFKILNCITRWQLNSSTKDFPKAAELEGEVSVSPTDTYPALDWLRNHYLVRRRSGRYRTTVLGVLNLVWQHWLSKNGPYPAFAETEYVIRNNSAFFKKTLLTLEEFSKAKRRRDFLLEIYGAAMRIANDWRRSLLPKEMSMPSRVFYPEPFRPKGVTEDVMLGEIVRHLVEDISRKKESEALSRLAALRMNQNPELYLSQRDAKAVLMLRMLKQEMELYFAGRHTAIDQEKEELETVRSLVMSP